MSLYHGIIKGSFFISPFFYLDRKSTRLNSSHDQISYAVFCLKKKNNQCSPWRPPSFFDAAARKPTLYHHTLCHSGGYLSSRRSPCAFADHKLTTDRYTSLMPS